jgi:hypothetical protein
MRQATDEAVQVGPVQIPEEEPRHRPSVTEAGCGFELRKDSSQLPVVSCQFQRLVSSFEFQVSSFEQCPPDLSSRAGFAREGSAFTDNWLLATDNCFPTTDY